MFWAWMPSKCARGLSLGDVTLPFEGRRSFFFFSKLLLNAIYLFQDLPSSG